MTDKPVIAHPRYLTQREAADILNVSASYLRASDCPKVLLPPNRGKRPLVRYRETEVLAWAEKWTARSTIQLQRSA